MHPTNCLNCGIALHHEEQFCGRCGQKAIVHRLSFHELWHDAVHYFTHADKGIFQLLKKLATHPGVVAREYVEGKRKKYFKPLNFWLIVAGIVVFMTSFFYEPNDKRSRQLEYAASVAKNLEQKKYLLAIAGRTKQVSRVTGKYSNVINMLATPVFTFFFWLFYYRGRYNYIEHLVANMYFVGFMMLFYALLVVPLNHFAPKLNFVVLGCFFLFEIIYRGFAYQQFMNKNGAWPTIKAYGTSFLLTVLWVGATMLIVFTYIRTGFQ